MKGWKSMIVMAALLWAPAASWAQSQTAEAESLFADGKRYMKEGKIEEACVAFATSQMLEARATTMLNLADCHEQDGMLATAWGEFLQARELAKKNRDKKSEAVATQFAERLKKKVSKLTIAVGDGVYIKGMEVFRVDEDRKTVQAVESLRWNHALPIDGGTYRIWVRAPKHEDWNVQVEVATKGDHKTVTVARLVEKREEPPAPPPAPKQPSEAASAAGAKLDEKCRTAEKTYQVIVEAPEAENKRVLRLIELAMRNPCFQSRLAELAKMGIRRACTERALDKAKLFFEKGGGGAALAGECPGLLRSQGK